MVLRAVSYWIKQLQYLIAGFSESAAKTLQQLHWRVLYKKILLLSQKRRAPKYRRVWHYVEMYIKKKFCCLHNSCHNAWFQITVWVRFGSVWFWLVTVLLIAWPRSRLICCILFIRNWEFDGRKTSVFVK